MERKWNANPEIEPKWNANGTQLHKWNPHGTMTDINKRIDMANIDNCYVDMNSVLKYTIQDEIAAESDKMKYKPNKQ